MTYISISISSSSFSDSSMVCQLDRFDWSPSSSMVCQLDRFDWSPSDSSMVCQLDRFDWLIDWLITLMMTFLPIHRLFVNWVDLINWLIGWLITPMMDFVIPIHRWYRYPKPEKKKQHLSQENRFEIKIWF